MSSIVFDQYQRYRFIERLIKILRTNDTSLVLEVGALGSPLRTLSSRNKLVLVDQQPGEIDIRANGLHLPFFDRSYEIVVSTDVLEHMKASDRVPFIRELQRVTSGVLILGFPHFDPKNAEADKIFFDFIRSYSGLDFGYLNEHQQYGLPQVDDIRMQTQSFLPYILEFKNSNVDSWLLLQLGNFTLLQHPEMEEVRALMNDFFNQSLEPISHDPPCYRTFLVCSRHPFPDDLKRELEKTDNHSEVTLRDCSAKLFALVNASEAAIQQQKKERTSEKSQLESNIHKLEQELSLQKQEIANQERQIQELNNTVRGQTLVNQNLQEYLNLFLKHPAYKIYKIFKDSLRRMVKNDKSRSYDLAYSIFQNTCEPNAEELKKQSSEWQTLAIQPRLNIVTSVFGPPMDIFRETIDSVLQQTYPNWVWNVVDASEQDDSWNLLTKLASREARIKPYRLLKNEGISANMNVAFRQASGDYVVVLDHDDTLAPHALFSVASAIAEEPDLDFLYSDADKLDESGHRCEPIFKPDWSPEMMLCCNILNQISVFRRSLLDEVGYLNPDLDGAQDWDLYFRIAEKTQRIHHIPQILYHWRKTPSSTARSISSKPYAKKAQLIAITNHLKRTGIRKPNVFFIPRHPIYRTYPLSRWEVTRNWKVSIIIPSRDRVHLLRECLDRLFHLTRYPNFEVVVVDTGSTEEETIRYYEELKNEPKFRIVSFQETFNFGKACNLGASQSTGDMFLFLNNDTQVLDGNWLDLMLQWFERNGVGVVGPKLLYPNGKIQHAGVIMGLGGLAGHVFAEEHENTFCIFGTDGWYRNFSAVTGACLMIPRELFSRANGFDETFHLIYSDVELCLRVATLGYRIVYSPDVRLIHHESATHGKQFPRVDFENASRKWRPFLEKGDAYYNPNLTSTSPRPDFKIRRDETLVQLNDILMNRLPEKEIIRFPADVQ